MVSLDVFHQDPFSTITLTTAVERVPFQPQALGQMAIFDPDPIRTTALAVEQRQGKLSLIPFSDRGAEGTQRTTERRDIRYFDVPRLMVSDTIYANELQNIRAFGTESELMQVEAEVARRVSGPTGLLNQLEYTHEYQRLASIQGMTLDADGSVYKNWFDEFNIIPKPEVAFNLSAQSANSIRPICNAIDRTMRRSAQGSMLPGSRIVALCGDAFYDAFVNHPDVIRTFLNWSDAADLRGEQGGAFSSFSFSEIDWVNYRGSDDNATIKIPDDKAKFFPLGAPGVFRVAYAPGESFQWVNTLGKPVYILPIFDRDRQAWWKMEAYSYPLYICTRPEVLVTGRSGS